MKLALFSVAALIVCAASTSGSQEPRVRLVVVVVHLNKSIKTVGYHKSKSIKLFLRYDGFKVIRTVPRTSDQAEYIASLEDDLNKNFWSNTIRYV